MIKAMNHHIQNIQMRLNLHGWAMSHKLPTNGFRWVEDLSQFNDDFIKK